MYRSLSLNKKIMSFFLISTLAGFLAVRPCLADGLKQNIAQGLSVFWPQKSIRFGGAGTLEKTSHDLPELSFFIPKEYLDASGIEKDTSGLINEISIAYELPGPTPFVRKEQDQVKLFTSETMGKKRLGKFYLVLKRDASYDYSLMKNKVYSAKNAYGKYLRSGDVDGLVRFSSYTCLSKHVEENKEFVEYVRNKERSDPSPEGCRSHRTSSEWLTEEAGEQFVFASCIVASCRLKFNLEGRAANITVNYEDMQDWKEIVGAARHLLEEFKIKVVN